MRYHEVALYWPPANLDSAAMKKLCEVSFKIDRSKILADTNSQRKSIARSRFREARIDLFIHIGPTEVTFSVTLQGEIVAKVSRKYQ